MGEGPVEGEGGGAGGFEGADESLPALVLGAGVALVVALVAADADVPGRASASKPRRTGCFLASRPASFARRCRPKNPPQEKPVPSLLAKNGTIFAKKNEERRGPNWRKCIWIMKIEKFCMSPGLGSEVVQEFSRLYLRGVVFRPDEARPFAGHRGKEMRKSHDAVAGIWYKQCGRGLSATRESGWFCLDEFGISIQGGHFGKKSLQLRKTQKRDGKEEEEGREARTQAGQEGSAGRRERGSLCA
ncbi:MAG: hypothetical protein JW741_03925 [Sedimentisphaerales bacterium]|nr:hypothetical protein [Sedimentisphaerales bacterium]